VSLANAAVGVVSVFALTSLRGRKLPPQYRGFSVVESPSLSQRGLIFLVPLIDENAFPPFIGDVTTFFGGKGSLFNSEAGHV